MNGDVNFEPTAHLKWVMTRIPGYPKKSMAGLKVTLHQLWQGSDGSKEWRPVSIEGSP